MTSSPQAARPKTMLSSVPAHKNVAGNYYDKYGTRNPLARWLMNGFLASFDILAEATGVRSCYEVGCGEGHLSLRLADRGWTVRGSDLEPTVVEQANANCIQRGHGPLFEVASLYELEPDQVKADLVICCEVLEHLPEPELALRTLARLARNYLLVSAPREPIWRFLNICRASYLANLGNTPGHIQHWSANQFVAMIQRHARIVEVRKPLPWTMALVRCA